MQRKVNQTSKNCVTMYGKEQQIKKNNSSNNHSSHNNNSNSGGGGGGWFVNTAMPNIQRENWDPARYDWSKTTF